MLLIALVAGGAVIQRRQDDQAVTVEAASPDALLPTAAAAGTLSSTWYCAGGTATGTEDGVAEQTVQVANASGDDLHGVLTVVPSEGDPATQPFDLPAHSRHDVIVSSVLQAPYASAVVEVDGGEVAVSHQLTGPDGTTQAACSSAPSDSWFLPAGTTRPGTRQLLALFNPFPSEAVATVSFETDDGSRTPQAYEGIVVPGGRVTVLDVGTVVTLRNEMSTTVDVLSGRMVVDQIQAADGSQGTTSALTVTPAAPQASSSWWFADGPTDDGQSTYYVVQNPADSGVDVELQVRLDDAATNGDVPPFEVTVPAHRYVVIPLSADGRVPLGVGYTAVLVSRGTPVVAERLVGTTPAADSGTVTPSPVGLALGAPVQATHWLVPAASSNEATSATVIVTNPSATDAVTITVSMVADGATTPLPGMADVAVPAGGRGGFDVPTGRGQPAVAIDVVASSPVSVEVRATYGDAAAARYVAVPVAGTAVVPTAGLTDVAAPVDTGSLVPGAGSDATAPIAPDDTGGDATGTTGG